VIEIGGGWLSIKHNMYEDGQFTLCPTFNTKFKRKTAIIACCDFYQAVYIQIFTANLNNLNVEFPASTSKLCNKLPNFSSKSVK